MSRQSDSSISPEDYSQNSSPSRPSSRVESDQAHHAHHGPTPVSERPSSSPHSPQGVSSTSSEGYPSWLPKRPPPPAPGSTFQSSMAGMFNQPGPSNEPYVVGRKPTPRSVRIVSLQGSTAQGAEDPKRQREPTDQSHAFFSPAHARVWSRATSAGLTPTLISSGFLSNVSRPRFRSTALHLELLRSPTWKKRLFFYLFPILVLGHIPLQTFFDFNAVYILILIAKYPNPVAPGVPGSGRNWALGAAAYIVCWFVWIAVVFIMYELLYSFYRRWRVKRPLMFPIYLSSPAFNYVCMTSYTNFCFMYHIRSSAFSGNQASIRDGLAETAYFYAQNWPTVALLMPRAALSLALLLAFSSPQVDYLALADAGISQRDGTFFASDGTLSGYARGVLIANAAWTAWRILVLLSSLFGLWIFSGRGCAGLCGPRYRWEEEDAEKTLTSFSGEDGVEVDALPWSWKERTLLRIKDAYDFCMTIKPPRPGSGIAKEGAESHQPSEPFEGIQQVFAAVGLPSVPHPARRPVLSGELFESPVQAEDELMEKVLKDAPGPSGVIPPESAVPSKEQLPPAGPSGPLEKLPYPFTGYGAQVSSEDVVPFPPSPEPEEEVEVPIEGGDEGGEEEEEEEEEEMEEGEEPSERRTSGSMSSLGRPVASRYPFQLRRPTHAPSVSSASQMSPRAHSYSTQTRSTYAPSAQSRSTPSQSTRNSRSTQSTGNPESTDSPMSNGSSSAGSPQPSSFSGSGIPMPPRHPQVGGRGRAGTVPGPSSSSSPSPVVFPGRPRAHTRTGTTDTAMTFGPVPVPALDSEVEDVHEGSLMDVPEAEGSIEEAEQHDSVGLLSAGPSPRQSLVNLRRRGSGPSHRRSNGSRSRSGTDSRSDSRSRTNSGNSRSESARSRAQSLIHSIGAASRSSLDLVRARANSMQRLSDSPFDSAASDIMSSPENRTFGHPLREQWRREEASQGIENIPEVPLPEVQEPTSETGSDTGENPRELRTMSSTLSTIASSEHPSEQGAQTERLGVPIPARGPAPVSQPDISTANQSFVTGSPTVEGRTTDSSERTPLNWGGTLADSHVEQQLAPGGLWRPL